MIKVTRYSPDMIAHWDDFVSLSKNGTFILQRGFMDYHEERFKDHSLMIYKNEQLVAVVPAHEKEQTLYTHQGLTYGGFVWHKKIKFEVAFECFKSVLCYACTQGLSAINLKEIPRIYAQGPCDELDYFLRLSQAECIKKDVALVIDYSHVLGFEKNRREGLNKAKRHKLKVTCDDNYDDFWNTILIPELSKKHQANPVHSLDEIRLLAARFPEHIKQVSVYDADKLVAGTTVFLTDTVVHPQYVMGDANKNQLGSIDLAYEFIINEFAQGRRYFDFNTSSEDNGAELNSGLLFWKQTCGARCVTVNQYIIDTMVHKDLKLNLI
jgi:hypothetical protein